VAKGPDGQRWGAGGGGESEAVRWWARTRGPGQHNTGAWFKLSLNQFKSIQRFRNRFKIPPNFDWSKRCIPLLQKLEIKYG
jgi:hypothetical protein